MKNEYWTGKWGADEILPVSVSRNAPTQTLQGASKHVLPAPGFHRHRLGRGGVGAFEEGEEVGVNRVGFCCGHAVGKILVGFQYGAFH
jgi:hypothetical protein